MARLEGPRGARRLPLAWIGGAATLAALAIALVLVVGGRNEAAASAYGPARNGLASVLAPLEEALAAPVRWVGDAVIYVEGYVFAISENRRLHREVAELEGWRDTALALKNVNERYEALLKLKLEPAVPMVSGRSIVDVRGPFSNARVIDVGASSGVQVGDPVLSEHGVIGRVVGASGGVSRVLLLSDPDSRTPVLADRSNGRAILIGDGGPYPRLDYLRGRDPVKVGDMLLTSGDGGVYPRGLPVGVAVKDVKGVWRARLYSDETPIDFVRVMLFQAFSRSPDAQALPDTTAAPPPLTPTEAADRQSALDRAAAPAPAPVRAFPKPGPTRAPETTSGGAATNTTAQP